MKPIVLSVDAWRLIREELHTEYPKSVFMIRDKMKSKLGFTVREHKDWIAKPDGGHSEMTIHLDFYSERKYTMFLLKFSEHIGKEQHDIR
jgi:hypothetical protein